MKSLKARFGVLIKDSINILGLRIINLVYPFIIIGLISDFEEFRGIYVFNLSIIFALKLLSIGTNDTIGVNIISLENGKRKSKLVSELFFTQCVIVLIFGILLKLIFYEKLNLLFILLLSLDFNWIYIGLKNEKSILRFNTILKLFSIISTIVLINNGLVGNKIMYTIGFIHLGVIIYTYFSCKIDISAFSFEESLAYIKKTKHPFLSKLISSGNDAVIPIVIGESVGLNSLYLYDISKKVTELCKIPSSILNTLILSRKNNITLNFSVKIVIVRFISSTLMVSLLFLTNNFWTSYFGVDFQEIENIFKWFSLILLTTSISYFITGYLFIKMNKLKEIGHSQYLATSILILYVIIIDLTIENIVIGLLIAELVKVIALIYFYLRKDEYI